ncbi:MAG: UDP-N-acetylglucosamine 2-epimerase [Deltaproteobacteria bacterium]|nr:UDP-N-acetylglucosamine 2-epimerase [Deltaproteobacteria bacterium]
MKIAPIYREALRHPEVECRIVHTGQHYDREMSQAFFDDLGLPAPHRFLNAGSGSHAAQTARIMVAFEPVCLEEKPDAVVVVGDVNSTLACSVVAKKLGIRVDHVEAGLRSFDLAMPEEINRMVTDAISDDFFVTEESGVANLLREGKSPAMIHLVGHVMIDNLGRLGGWAVRQPRSQAAERTSAERSDAWRTNGGGSSKSGVFRMGWRGPCIGLPRRFRKKSAMALPPVS